MFPLSTVVFPGMSVPLHVFEDRYRMLVRHLLEEEDPAQRVFGTVAIREGYEVGDHGAQSVYRVGCVLQLTEVERRDDGTFDIVAVARDEAGLEEAVRAVRARGRRCLTVVADMADPEDTVSAARRALAEWGTIDILVNNAAIGLVESLLEASMESFDKVMAVNLRAPLLMAQILAPGMIEQRRGKIINVSSQTGVIALVDHATYAASKAGLFGFSQSMAREIAFKGITVNCVAPGYIATEMVAAVPEAAMQKILAKIPVGRLGEAHEIARAVQFLADDDAGFITGSVISVNGGMDM